jgi:uncharacterized damage-inducible protein DinB
MANDNALREHLVALLRANNAHMDFEEAIADFHAELRGKRPDGSPHSPWDVLEHMRIAQWDILEFIRNPGHVSPDFPEGYWPNPGTGPSAAAWDESAAAFRADLDAVVALARDESQDLYAKIPHGDGQTLLTEILLVADHNSYHIGQLSLLRDLLK